MITAVGHIKGGVGKTTIAVNLAIAASMKGDSVVLIDADEQATATLFTEIREQEIGDAGYSCVAVKGAQVRSQGAKLSEKFDTTIIDCGGRDTDSFRAALTICDALIVPIPPRSFDFWAITQLVRLLDEVESIRKLPQIHALINMADPTGSDNREVMEALEDYPQINVLADVLVRRKAWPNSASKGLSVYEQSPLDKKAVAEFDNIIKTILK